MGQQVYSFSYENYYLKKNYSYVNDQKWNSTMNRFDFLFFQFTQQSCLTHKIREIKKFLGMTSSIWHWQRCKRLDLIPSKYCIAWFLIGGFCIENLYKNGQNSKVTPQISKGYDFLSKSPQSIICSISRHQGEKTDACGRNIFSGDNDGTVIKITNDHHLNEQRYTKMAKLCM